MAYSNPEHVSDAAAAIERYLSARPQAAETAEGIARWWLVRQRYDDSVDLVRRALDLLVRQGVVERLALSGGQPMYRKAQESQALTHIDSLKRECLNHGGKHPA